jgi:hypothetical protein
LILATRKAHLKDLISSSEEILMTSLLSVKILGCEETITKAISVAEILKRKHPTIKQQTRIYRKDFTYKVGEETLVKKKSCIEIQLFNDKDTEMKI